MDQIMLTLKSFAEKEFEDEDVFIAGAIKFDFTYKEIHVVLGFLLGFIVKSFKKLETQYEKTIASENKGLTPSPTKPRK